jgi:hypothetical protein
MLILLVWVYQGLFFYFFEMKAPTPYFIGMFHKYFQLAAISHGLSAC